MENVHKMIACAEEDRISNLPDQLIDLILDLLPLQDAIRTSVFSKRWLYRWTTMPTLNFDEQFSTKFAKNGAYGPDGFITIINRVMFFHKGPISKFYLHIPYMLLDSLQEVDQWILMLSRNDVREFILINSNYRTYRLPSFMFSCLELRKLKLNNCIMKPSLEFQGFPNLEDLCLQFVDFEATSGGSVIKLPKLKTLKLYRCTNAYNFYIKATKLHELVVIDCADVTSLRLFSSQCLTVVGMYSSNPTQASAQADKKILDWMSSNLPNMRYFYTNGYFLKLYIAEYVPKWLPCALNCLNHLSLLNIRFGDLVQLQAALTMLRNLPNLYSLRVKNEQKGLDDVHFDAEPTSYCLDQPLKQLQNVNIASVEGSQPELLFIKLLLDHSPNLKNMSITLGTTIFALKRLKFAKDVRCFRRAAENVKILLGTIPMATKFPLLQ